MLEKGVSDHRHERMTVKALQPAEFLITGAKRLLQQYRPKAAFVPIKNGQ